VSNILVTGGAGSMGRLVSENLINHGHQVNIFDLPQANYESFDSSKTKIFKGNLNDSSIEESIVGMDTVIHLAAILPPTANINPELAEKVNVEGTRNLLSCIEKIDPNRSRQYFNVNQSDVRSIVRGELNQLKRVLASAANSGVNTDTKYHYRDCIERINTILEPK